MKRYIGGKPSDRAYLKASESSYENKAFNNIEGYEKIFDGETIDAFLNKMNNEILVGIRGTTLNIKDLTADINLVGNNLNKTNRFKNDLFQFRQIVNKYPPNQYSYYLAGHSLGGAIVKEFKREFPFIKDSMTFNSASQPKDLVNQRRDTVDNYIDKDFLYNLTGRFINNKRVFGYKPKQTKGVFGWLKQKATPTAINAHKLEQFDKVYGNGKRKLIIQSVMIPKDKFSKREANKWIKENNFINKRVDITENYYRYRQEEPELFNNKSYRTKKLNNGVSFIFGKFKKI